MTTHRAAVGVPEEHRTVVVDGPAIAYSDRGAGVPFICLHATGHGARDFEHLDAMLPAGFRVIAIDWPGQGRSGSDSRPASAGRYAELLAGIVETLKLERAVILGNSIGGAAAIEYAANNPERVAGLILADPGGLAKLNPFIKLFCAVMTHFFLAGAKGRRWFKPMFRRYYNIVLSRGPIQEHRTRIVDASYEHASVLAQAWSSFGIPDADIRALCPKLQCPVFVAWAKHDRVIPYRFCRKAIQSIPDVEVELFNAGHAAFLEDPDAFGAHLPRFLNRVGAATSSAMA